MAVYDTVLRKGGTDGGELYGGVEGDDAWNAAKALDLTLTKRNIPEYGRENPAHRRRRPQCPDAR